MSNNKSTNTIHDDILSDPVSDSQDVAENGSTIQLTDDNGKQVSYELLDIIDYSGTDYAVLVPAQENESGPDEVEIFRVEDGDQEVNTLIPVTNPETAQAIFDLFRTKNAGKFDFE